MRFKKVAVVGFGLLGASFALALKELNPQIKISAIGRNAAKLQAALESGMADEVGEEMSLAEDADLAVVSTPVSTIPDMIKKLSPHLKEGALLSDFGSTKRYICERAAKEELNGAIFIGAHPIAGSERSGFKNAEKDLFKSHAVVLCPDEKTPRRAVDEYSSLWKMLGAEVKIMKAGEHDEILAHTSHLVHLASSALVGAVSDGGYEGFFGSGFYDTTRVAKGSEKIWNDIVKTNKSDILNALDKYGQEVYKLYKLIEEDDYQNLSDYLKRSREYREKV